MGCRSNGVHTHGICDKKMRDRIREVHQSAIMRNGIAIAVGIAVATATASITKQTSTEQCRITTELTLSQEATEPESCSERVLGTTRIVVVMALVAVAFARRKSHMIMRSPRTSAGASETQPARGYGYGSLEHRKIRPCPRVKSFEVGPPWSHMESDIDQLVKCTLIAPWER